jgi:hypothetical protein
MAKDQRENSHIHPATVSEPPIWWRWISRKKGGYKRGNSRVLRKEAIDLLEKGIFFLAREKRKSPSLGQ